MEHIKKAAVIGGDERCAVCADLFSKNGTECAVFGLENFLSDSSATKCTCLSDALGGCDILILPLPVMKDSASLNSPLSAEKILLADIFSLIDDDVTIYAGNPQKCFFSLKEAFGRKNDVINYANLESFAILGSVPTAEGAVIEAVKASKKTISGSAVLVCGCGRVGKQLALLLKAMNANVTVSARKNCDLSWISSNGFSPVHTYEIGNCKKAFDVIFNTVPYMIFDGKVLSKLRGKPVIIELASKPYGAEFNIKTCIYKRKKRKIFCKRPSAYNFSVYQFFPRLSVTSTVTFLL